MHVGLRVWTCDLAEMRVRSRNRSFGKDRVHYLTKQASVPDFVSLAERPHAPPATAEVNRRGEGAIQWVARAGRMLSGSFPCCKPFLVNISAKKV
jgi:hypothetical protein